MHGWICNIPFKSSFMVYANFFFFFLALACAYIDPSWYCIRIQLIHRSGIQTTAVDHLYSLSLKTLEQKQVEYLFCLRINNTKKKQIACEKLSAGLVGCARLSQWCNARATLESPGSKLPERTLRLKMVNLISCEPLAHISYIKLIRADTVSEILHYLIFANRPRKGWVLSLCSCFLYIQLTASSFSLLIDAFNL